MYMGICTILFLIFGILLFVTRKYKGNYGRERLIIQILHMEKWIKKEKYQSLMKQLYPLQNKEQKLLEFWYKKIRYIAFVGGVFLILGMFSELSSFIQNTQLFDAFYLKRPSYGEGANTVSLEVSHKSMGKQKINVDVLEQTYGEEERNKAFENAKAYIETVYLGENKSKNTISKPLVLPDKIPGTTITVSWMLDEVGIFFKDGSINKEELREQEREVIIYATLTYQEWSKKYTFPLRVIPEKKTEQELFWEKWKKSLSNLNEKTKIEPYLTLPKEVDGSKVYYKEAKKSKSIQFLVLSILGGFLASLQLEEKLKRNEKKREEELLLSYPSLVNKFALLLGAGMTIGGAFEKICLEYTKEQQKKEAKIKYAYEEMLITQKDILNGVSEVKAVNVVSISD